MHDKALEAFNRALQLDPHNAEGYLALHTQYMQMHERNQALQTLETGIALAMQHRGEEWAETLGGILETSKNQIDTQTK